MVGCPIGWKADVGKCATDGWKIKGVFLSSFFFFFKCFHPMCRYDYYFKKYITLVEVIGALSNTIWKHHIWATVKL